MHERGALAPPKKVLTSRRVIRFCFFSCCKRGEKRWLEKFCQGKKKLCKGRSETGEKAASPDMQMGGLTNPRHPACYFVQAIRQPVASWPSFARKKRRKIAGLATCSRVNAVNASCTLLALALACPSDATPAAALPSCLTKSPMTDAGRPCCARLGASSKWPTFFFLFFLDLFSRQGFARLAEPGRDRVTCARRITLRLPLSLSPSPCSHVHMWCIITRLVPQPPRQHICHDAIHQKEGWDQYIFFHPFFSTHHSSPSCSFFQQVPPPGNPFARPHHQLPAL